MTEFGVSSGEQTKDYEVEVVNATLTFEPNEFEKLRAALEKQRLLRTAEQGLLEAARRLDSIEPRGVVGAVSQMVGYQEDAIRHTDFGSAVATGHFDSEHSALRDGTLNVAVMQKFTNLVYAAQEHDFSGDDIHSRPEYPSPTTTYSLIFDYSRPSQEVEVHVLTSHNPAVHAADFEEFVYEPLVDKLRARLKN